jgi:serine/threonine protein kinase
MQYEDLCQIGAGMYGKVFKARVVGTDVWVAIKRTTILESDEGIPQTAVREIAVLRKLQHQNIVRLLDATATRQDVSLVLEFVDMDLARYMKESHCHLDPRITRSLSQQLMLGIEFCHRNSIMHRDIKPQNLLVDSKLQLKITDFGLARMYSVPVPVYTREIVTLWYRAPEILLQGWRFGGGSV